MITTPGGEGSAGYTGEAKEINPVTERELRRENYPGQYTTPDDCPVCHGPIEVARVEVSMGAVGPRAGQQRDVEGRWSCPRGCDPRTLMRKAQS